MASSSSSVCEEQLLCSICLDVFCEPVTTPCGHNYCQSCITDYWNSTKQIRCPLCKKKFRQKPALRCNTIFRDMLEQLRSLSMSDHPEEQQAEPGDVPCDICLPPKRKALNTCVVCLSSYCSRHLEPHHRVPGLKKHRLIKPTSNLEHRVCQKHNKMFELYCSDDKTCVCSLCPQDDHVDHQCIPLERAFSEEKVSAQCGIEQLNMMEKDTSRDIQQTKLFLEQSKKKREADLDVVNKGFAALMDSLVKHREALEKVIEQNYSCALKPHEDRVCELQKGVTDIQQRRAELVDLLQSDDPLLCLMNKSAALHPLPHEDRYSECDPDEDLSCCSTVEEGLRLMDKSLCEEMEELIQQVQRSEEEDGSRIDAVWLSPKDKLLLIQQNYAVDFSLDPHSAAPVLSVNQEGKTLIYNARFPAFAKTQSSIYTRRFQDQPFALSSSGFSSCRFYFEVEVRAQRWIVGVVRENFNRQMTLRKLPGPAEGAWIMSNWTWSGLRHFGSSFVTPQKIGIFVDYDKGEVSFYDVDAEVLVSCYRECLFQEPVPLPKSFLYDLVGVSCKTKLYPIFGAYCLHDNLKIIPVVNKV